MSSTIDDQDFSRVQYTGSWTRGGISQDHAGTVSSSTVIGDSFTVSFNGASITVFGTLDSTSGGTVTSYSIDAAPPSQVTAPDVSGNQFNQIFWQSPTLAAENNHKLVVEIIQLDRDSDSDNKKHTVWFDYFEVSSSVSSSAGSHKRVAAIAGGVAGGVILLLVVAIACLLLFRRQARRKKGPRHDIDNDSFCSPEERYISVVHADNRPTESTLRGQPYANVNNFNDTGIPSSPIREKTRLSVTNPHPLDVDAHSSISKPEDMEEQHSISPPENLIQHIDSGSRVHYQGVFQKPRELPPVYTAE